MAMNSEARKLSRTYLRYIQSKNATRKQSKGSRKEIRLDCTVRREASKDQPIYVIQNAVTSSRPVVSCPPKHARERILASAMSQNRSAKSRRRNSSTGARLREHEITAQSQKLEYNVVTMKETEKEKNIREKLLEEVKKQNWIRGEEATLHSAYVTPKNKLGLVRQKYTLRAESAERRIKDRPRVTFKTSSHFCDRALRLENGDFSKQFCEIFGPGMCTDCTKSRRQHISIEDHIQSYPGVAVSPYVLCVPQEKHEERAPKTPSAVFRNCDVLYRRRSLSRTSRDSPDDFRSSRARPNSSNDERAISAMSDVSSSSYPLNDTSARFMEHSWNAFPRTETPCSSVLSSRRSSITRNVGPALPPPLDQHGASPVDDNFEGKSCTAGTPKRINRLSPQIENLRDSPSRLSSSRSRLKTPSIERTGKLREMPYWRFLIPEPPEMEVGRMNVSIFSPKEIPGIKIFDESFFEL